MRRPKTVSSLVKRLTLCQTFDLDCDAYNVEYPHTVLHLRGTRRQIYIQPVSGKSVEDPLA